MRLLVSGTTSTMRRLASGHPAHLGHLVVPRAGNALGVLAATGLPLAADNGAFGRFRPALFAAMIERLRPYRDRLLWVACPDVVGDAAATRVLFSEWRTFIQPLPVAYVAQDGLTPRHVPWAQIRCLFIGGTTAWKCGREASALIREAQRRGKLVHIGRVNTLRRLRAAYELGADSVDGTSMSRFGDTHVPRFLAWLNYLERQHRLTWND